jgi:hypothetical protein
MNFLVEGNVVTTGPGAAHNRVTLVVNDALAIAERCWDAGFKVLVRAAGNARSIVVVDPFGLELELIASILFTEVQPVLRQVRMRGARREGHPA